MVEIIDANEYDTDLSATTRAYRQFLETENIHSRTDFYVRDLDELETKPWDRTGQEVTFVNLVGMEGLDDLHVHSIGPGGETNEISHFYQQMIYVLKGSGLTRIESGDFSDQFEWDKNSVFVLPRNVDYKHVNISSDEEAKLVCHTDLPQVVNMTLDSDFIFESEHDFLGNMADGDVYSGEGDIEARYLGEDNEQAFVSWEANFIPDITQFNQIQEHDWINLGAMKALSVPWPLLNPIQNRQANIMHMSSIPKGSYKPAHRHYPGANVFITEGEGYTLLWNDELAEEDAKLRVDWGPRSVFTPPGLWWHHHFNLSDESARQFAFHPPAIGTMRANLFDALVPENRLFYVNEDEEIREIYKRELEERGIAFDMPSECYENPDHELNSSGF